MTSFITISQFLLLVMFFSCGDKTEYVEEQVDSLGHELFEEGVVLGKVGSEINEASGLAASINNPGFIWTHNDSGDKARIFLINELGEHIWTVVLNNAENIDWEDIVTGPGPDESKNYIYIGDIGDNEAKYNSRTIYRIEEPVFIESEHLGNQTLIEGADKIEFQYPNGARDAETLMLDSQTRDLYIISKREARVFVYNIPFPQKIDKKNTPENLGEIPFNQIVAGDISSVSGDVLIKSYNTVFYWVNIPSLKLQELLNTEPIILPYTREEQGESIAWKKDESGYYTLSEKKGFSDPELYFYKKK